MKTVRFRTIIAKLLGVSALRDGMGKVTRTTTTVSANSGSVCEAVVEAVAEVQGISPLDVRPPLYEVVDPDSLDELFASGSATADRTAGRVVFPYGDYEVTVSGNGEISVDAARASD